MNLATDAKPKRRFAMLPNFVADALVMPIKCDHCAKKIHPLRCRIVASGLSEIDGEARWEVHVVCQWCRQILRIPIRAPIVWPQVRQWVTHLARGRPSPESTSSPRPPWPEPSRRHAAAPSISAAELIEARRTIWRSETHDDFLRAIGASSSFPSQPRSKRRGKKRK
jgi:hypothetical protein